VEESLRERKEFYRSIVQQQALPKILGSPRTKAAYELDLAKFLANPKYAEEYMHRYEECVGKNNQRSNIPGDRHFTML
jgi:hypothetical protein